MILRLSHIEEDTLKPRDRSVERKWIHTITFVILVLNLSKLKSYNVLLKGKTFKFLNDKTKWKKKKFHNIGIRKKKAIRVIRKKYTDTQRTRNNKTTICSLGKIFYSITDKYNSSRSMQVNLHTHPSRSWFNSSFVMDIRSSLKSCRDISLRFECATRNVICCSAVNLPLNAPATCSKESIFSHTTSIRSPCPPWWPALLAVAVATAAAAAAAADWPGLITELENSSCRQVHGLISRRTAQWRLVLAANPKSV